MRWIPMAFVWGVLGLAPLGGADGPVTKASAPVRGEYGKIVGYADSPIAFPDFVIRFLQREDFMDPVSRTIYRFEVTGRDGQKLAELRFQMAGVFRNEQAFLVGGKTIVIEKFLTAAGMPLPWRQRDARKLGDAELVAWDEASAKAENPHVFEIGYLRPQNWLIPVNK